MPPGAAFCLAARRFAWPIAAADQTVPEGESHHNHEAMVAPNRAEDAARHHAARNDPPANAAPRSRTAPRAWHVALACALFAANVLVHLPALSPSLREIGDWDESWYIHWGHRLHELHRPALSASPLVGAIYAVIYPIAKHADLWLVTACRLGRIFFCVATWFVLYAVVKEALLLTGGRAPRASAAAPSVGRTYCAWLATMLLFTASSAPSHLLATPNYQWGNPSDATFAVVSGIALWLFLRFHVRKQLRYLAALSFTLGLGVLARMDGLVLSIVVLLGVLVLHARRIGLRPMLGPALVPFATVVGGFLLAYAAIDGTFRHGVASRSYQAFEEGQAALKMTVADWRDYQRHTRPFPFDGSADEVRQRFGTRQENEGSVLRALANHPQAAVERLRAAASSIPEQAVAAYGALATVPLVLFATRGLLALVEKRRTTALVMFLVWPAPLATYLFFFYRPGYFLLFYTVPFALAALGFRALPSDLASGRRWAWLFALTLALTLAAAFDRPVLAAGVALVLCVLAAALAVRRWRTFGFVGADGAVAVATLLVALFGVREATLPEFPQAPGAEEAAARFMRARLPDRARIAAFGPGPLWAANPSFERIALELADGRAPESAAELARWVEEAQPDAVYVNPALAHGSPESHRLLALAVGTLFDVGYEDPSGKVRVLLRRRHGTHDQARRSDRPARSPATASHRATPSTHEGDQTCVSYS